MIRLFSGIESAPTDCAYCSNSGISAAFPVENPPKRIKIIADSTERMKTLNRIYLTLRCLFFFISDSAFCKNYIRGDPCASLLNLVQQFFCGKVK